MLNNFRGYGWLCVAVSGYLGLWVAMWAYGLLCVAMGGCVAVGGYICIAFFTITCIVISLAHLLREVSGQFTRSRSLFNKKIKQIRATNASLCCAFVPIIPAIAATPKH